MGHRFEVLNLPAHLVAWHEVGLELLCKDMLGTLSDVDARPARGTVAPDGVGVMSGPAGQAVQSVVSQACEAFHSRPASAYAGQPVIVETSSTYSSAPSEISNVPGQPRQEHFANDVKDQKAFLTDGTGSKGESACFSGDRQTVPASESYTWTGPFQYAFERLKQPVHAVWTYWELALDFGGDPDCSRRQLWANIIKNLPYKQHVGFWPLSESQDGIMLAKPALFWQGVREFGATHVLCFGRRACMTLFPDRPFSPGFFQYESLTAVILPGPEDMLPDNRQLKAVTWNLLKGLRV